jgi:hypothetical protein
MILMAGTRKVAVFWNMMPHNELTDNRAPEECAASIFRVGCHKHGRHKLFQNAGINLPD